MTPLMITALIGTAFVLGLIAFRAYREGYGAVGQDTHPRENLPMFIYFTDIHVWMIWLAAVPVGLLVFAGTNAYLQELGLSVVAAALMMEVLHQIAYAAAYAGAYASHTWGWQSSCSWETCKLPPHLRSA